MKGENLVKHQELDSLKRTARIVGALFLTAMVGSLVGGVAFVEPSLTAPDYLTVLSENETRVIVGVFLELVNGIAVLGIGVFTFPILRQRDEHIALGYLGLRIVESVFCCVIVISPLSLITLSQAYVRAGAADAAYYQAAGALSIAEREGVAGLLIPVFFGLGSLLFYRALYQSRLLPRSISVWGFVGAALILVLNLLLAFGVQVGSAGMVLALPIISNEILLGIWLIAKGFDPSATASGAAE